MVAKLDADDYTIVPLSILDGTVGNTDIVTRLSLALDAPLSFEKLQVAWYEALQVRPIMQALVRPNKSAASGLAYHVLTPKGMTKYLEKQSSAPDHLKDLYFLDQSHRSVTEYCPGLGTGLGSPIQTKGVFVTDGPDPKDQKRCTAFNAIETFEELITSDRPITTIQVTRFSDVTLISLSVSHILGDLFTIKSILKAWEAKLYGKPLEPLEGLGRDPFTAYGPGGHLAGDKINSDSPELPPGWKIYGTLDKVRFLSRMLWDIRVARPESTISPKYVFIPDEDVVILEKQAKKDLIELEERRKKQGISVPRPLFASKSDILHAWLLKNNHAHLSSDQWTTPVNIVNVRARPPTGMKAGTDDFPANNWYGAGMLAALSSLKVGKLKAMSLGELALHVREGTKTGSTPENTRKFLTFMLHNTMWKAPTNKVALWSPPNHYWTGLSDWRLLSLHDLDMTPARLDEKKEAVTLCGMNVHMNLASGTQRNRWVCLGEAGGGIWFVGITSDAEWKDPRGFGKYNRLERQSISSKL